ncbi:SO2930 family diheme c-type cytochrome [Pleomorphovibrio marinus]|uniref:SO2930 family diheme c-type cytochrome n=1 Tax=Pleomorphovibrio marinus TaxID=2164132 RepID=UPI000E0BF1D8|nr:SO2930 family diheme c-type cytochrome [Pleomorphovibrio marinus]
MNTSLMYSPLATFLIVVACNSSTKNETAGQPVPLGDWEAPDVEISTLNFDQMPFKKLSEYGFFKGKIREFDPGNGVLLYEPVSSLFTDYAFKTRYIWMPEEASATIQDDPEGTFDFPEKTVLVKNFYYPADFRKPSEHIRVIETRIMVKKDGTWQAFPYLWNEEQTDAHYKAVGAEVPVNWVDDQGQEQLLNYIVPNQAQCKSCHNSEEVMVPLGVKAKHLNHDLPGKENQLIAWEVAGYLEGLKPLHEYPAMVSYNDTSSDLELRAKAYLDINCAHCHRAEGPASTSGLFLNYEETDPAKLGVFKTPVAAGFGAGSFTYAIWPGKSDESILTYRMGTNQVGAAMPEIGRGMVHSEGMELIKAWIDAMPEESFQHLSADK